MSDQAPELRESLRWAITFVRAQREAGKRPSAIAQQLRQRGLFAIQMLFVAREATGLGLGKLKAAGQRWSESVGVQDAAGFDAYSLSSGEQ